MHLINRIILSGVIVIGAATPGLACWCAGPGDEESLRRADVVFVGKMLESADPNKESFQVQQVIKGAAAGRIEVDARYICDSESLWGGQGNTYLVYAQKHRGILSLQSCGGTRQVEAAKVPAVAAYGSDQRQRSMGEMAIITAICVSLSLSLGYLVKRMRKR